ncbi:MAG TPA: VTT domain-containing protein [Polyangia bacterium]|jgi:uncharacterized membrane protein YdjX (TVP38/TMEM64 family)
MINEGPPKATVAQSTRPARRSAVGYAAAGAAVLAVLALWLLTPLRSYARVDALVALGATVRESPFALPWVLAAFVAGSLVFIPITPLLVATALVFSPLRGLVYGLLATSLAGWITHACGRLLRRRRVRWLEGPRFQALCARLRRRGFLAVLVARLLPFGSFTLFNVAAGAMEIPTLAFLAGSALGLLPRMLAFMLLADSLGQALRDPQPRTVTLFCLAMAISAAGLYWLRRRAARVPPSPGAVANDGATSARVP